MAEKNQQEKKPSEEPSREEETSTLSVIVGGIPLSSGEHQPEKLSWPELVGLSGEEAERKLKEERPDLKIHLIPANSMVTMDLRPDRVRIFFDDLGKVATPPRIG